MKYRDNIGKIYNLEKERIAHGGEGNIYAIIGDDTIVAKIFKEDKRTPEREEKLKMMVTHKLSSEHLENVAWPLEVIYDVNGFAGYIMQKVNDASPLTVLYSKNIYDLRYRLIVALNLCIALEGIHKENQVCGDLNPQNICVNLNKDDKQKGFHVTLVDVDSYHFRTGENVYRCEVGQGYYLAPELHKKMTNGKTLINVSLPTYTQETDLFALAVHIFMLLMNGCHPFACARKDTDNIPQVSKVNNNDSLIAPQPIDNIRDGFFTFYDKREDISIPIYAPDFLCLPWQLQKLFLRSFKDGYQDPKLRPTATEWIQGLKQFQEKSSYIQCAKGHFYFNNGQMGCPFCKVVEQAQRMMDEEKGVYKKEDDNLSITNDNFYDSCSDEKANNIFGKVKLIYVCKVLLIILCLFFLLLITYCCNTSYSYVSQRMQEQNYKNILVKRLDYVSK